MEKILKMTPGRVERRDKLMEEGHEELTDFLRSPHIQLLNQLQLLHYAHQHEEMQPFRPRVLNRDTLVQWGLLAVAAPENFHDAYDSLRPTEEGTKYFLYDEKYHLIMVREGCGQVLLDRFEEEQRKAAGEMFEKLGPAEKTATIFLMRDFAALLEFHAAESKGELLLFKDHEGTWLSLPYCLALHRIDDKEELSFLSALEELFAAPDEVREVDLPGGLHSRRYIRFYPGLVLFGLVDTDGSRIYDWFGLWNDPTAPEFKEQAATIRHEFIGKVIYTGPEHPLNQRG